jgi:hypothetical protein
MKYAFLLSRECGDARVTGSYDFVPYKFGPFSFLLYRDLDNLGKGGYIRPECEGGSVHIEASAEDIVGVEVAQLPQQLRLRIQRLADRHKARSLDALLGDVYARFPWFAMHTERKDLISTPLPGRPEPPVAVYTAGYEGDTVDGFFSRLLTTGIRRILDVRANPVSRKYGFARSSMNHIAESLGVRFYHMPQLGIPPALRKDLGTPEAYHRLLDWYETTLPGRSHAVAQAADHLQAEPSVLVCAEKDPAFCHRGRLSKALAEFTGLEVIHMGWPTEGVKWNVSRY